ncbi:glycogen synthase [bacterium]|nr:glycogen synthase [bacterium]
MKILFVSSEVAPFAKAGELADVASSLPKMLKETGQDVRVITPQYRSTNERKYVLRDVIRLQNIPVPLGKETVPVHVKSAFLPGSKVQAYFIDYRPFFFREGLYSDLKTRREYKDNARRFILFNRAVLETLIKLQWQPDVIHCHNWQSALIPLFLKTAYRNDPFFSKTNTLLTVHHFASQGHFPFQCVEDLNIEGDFSPQIREMERENRFSFLAAGLACSDAINTVSETYAREVLGLSGLDHGLHHLLHSRKQDFSGITNGIDLTQWNPAGDPFLPLSYGPQDLDKKSELKKALSLNQGLPFNPETPLLALVSPLTDQKGLQLVCDAADALLRQDCQWVILGAGEDRYHKFFLSAKRKHKKRIGLNLKHEESLAHLVLAGSDILLMPSLEEPCGLTQMQAMRYGTIPVVRKTGGLADTVSPFNPKSGRGNGFVFQKAEARDLIASVRAAIALFQQKAVWQKIMRNAMAVDFSWESPAKKYVQLYSKCTAKKNRVKDFYGSH